jgi:hypothetical protein
VEALDDNANRTLAPYRLGEIQDGTAVRIPKLDASRIRHSQTPFGRTRAMCNRAPSRERSPQGSSLQHPPRHFDVLGCISAIANSIEIAHFDFKLDASLDTCHRSPDLSGHECLPAPM